MPKSRQLLAAGLLALLAACTAPTTQQANAEAAGSPQTANERPAPPAPAPAQTPAPVAAESPGEATIDRSCSTDADCQVKNVGNCCGYYPACVNKDSPTDPAGVQAACQAKGMMSTCGFREISACACNAGECESAGDGAALQIR